MTFKVTWLKITKTLDAPGRSITYSITMDTTDCGVKDIEAARVGAEGMLDKWLREFATRPPGVKPLPPAGGPQPPAAPTQAPQFDIADLNALPWKGKNKVDSPPGQWGWILSDPNKHKEDNYTVVKQLADTLSILGGQPLDMGEVVFCFSGDKKQFIHRKPKKQERAR